MNPGERREPRGWQLRHAGGNAYRFAKEALTVFTVLKAHHLAPSESASTTESPNGTMSGPYAGFVKQIGSTEAAAEVASGTDRCTRAGSHIRR